MSQPTHNLLRPKDARRATPLDTYFNAWSHVVYPSTFGKGWFFWCVLIIGAGIAGQAQTKHWAFQKPVRPAVPKVKQVAWVKNPIDAFLLSKLEAKGLKPSPPADKRTLLRRVTFDLTGLPPTPEEIAAFLADKSPNAYEKVVNRLLASPRYGERWAQHWLDVVRFGETNGFELDVERPQAWRYRDYVVRALNADRPYNRFLMEQIAGDEIAPDDFEMWVATGFLRAGPQHVVSGNQDEAANRQEWLTEAVTGIGNSLLGLTINCARCHDHKYDPVSQKDYYALQAFLAAADNKAFSKVTEAEKKAHEEAVKAHTERLKPIKAEIDTIEKPYRERLRAEKYARLEPAYKQALETPAKDRTKEQRTLAQDAGPMLSIAWDELVAALSPEDRAKRAELRRRMHALDLAAPAPLPIAPGVTDTRKPIPATHILVRGEPNVPGVVVTPDIPTVLRKTSLPPRPLNVDSPAQPPNSGGSQGVRELAPPRNRGAGGANA